MQFLTYAVHILVRSCMPSVVFDLFKNTWIMMQNDAAFLIFLSLSRQAAFLKLVPCHYYT